MTSFLDFWGCGKGPLRHLAPSTRIICGTLVLVCCFVAPVHTPVGIIFFTGVVVGWTLLGGMPWKSIAGLFLYAGILFLPLFLLTPWIETPASVNNRWASALAVPLEIGIRGTASVFICVSTAAILDLSELHRGLTALPLPRLLVALILQIIHQTAMLAQESQRISCALRVRGMTSIRIPQIRYFFSLPTIWLLRISHRAERVAAAMDLRGVDTTARNSKTEPWLPLDVFAATSSGLLLGMAIILKWLNSA